MNIEIPKDLLNKTDREIKEMISEIGLINFSKVLVSFLETPKKIEELKSNPQLLEKMAFTIDSVLMYYQMTKNSSKIKSNELPIKEELINQFLEIYSTHSKENYDCY